MSAAKAAWMSRILFGVFAFISLALGAVAGFVGVQILLRIQDRSAAVWMACVLLILIAGVLIALGLNFGRRVKAGENTWSWGFTRGGSERLRISGYSMFLAPIWYPLLEEGGLRWPRVDDIPFYILSGILGWLMIRIAGHAFDEAQARYEKRNRD